MQVQGVIVGRYIELLQEINLPDGQPVTVDIHAESLSLAEKQSLVDEVCGLWADDSSLSPIFKEIEQNRRASLTRKVDFDAAS
ncbi:hypothetical protein [Candidatus Electronema sp. PJ]|uniref:hypothetical protein n=1 Tax=Candidatus Electronema sp. PJ TaxID=3401572 RepID=UPI003AA8F181